LSKDTKPARRRGENGDVKRGEVRGEWGKIGEGRGEEGAWRGPLSANA